MAENKNLGIDLELDETVAQGNYSNLAIIAHSTSEFINYMNVLSDFEIEVDKACEAKRIRLRA